MSEQISSSRLQEDLLILLCFNNDRARMLAGLLEPEHFGAIYARIAEAAIRYVKKHGDAPDEALIEMLDPIVSKKDAVGIAVEKTLVYLFQSKEHVNEKHTIDRLDSFIRRQNLRGGIVAAINELKEDVSNEQIDKIERNLIKSLNRRIEVFEHGINLGDVDSVLKCLDVAEDQTFPTGIRELDAKQAGPVRGGLHLLVAPAKAGKTTWLCHLGKIATIHQKKVLHISLEMSEPRVILRYVQSIFSVSKHEAEIIITKFKRDENKNFIGYEQGQYHPKLFLDSPDIRPDLRKKIIRNERFLKRIEVKSFPTGTLTLEELSAYLDYLADSKGFVPDIILLDYADLMRFNTRDFRIALGNLYKDLRGFAGERDIAIATVTQANRQASRKGKTTAEDVSEDWSKIATADTILTYASSPKERGMGLARITVAAHRNDEDKFSIIVTQNYNTCQFMLESDMLNQTYLDLINDKKDDDV